VSHGRTLLIAGTLALLGLSVVAGQELRVTTPTNLADVAVRSFRIHPDANVYMLAGAGSNVTADGIITIIGTTAASSVGADVTLILTPVIQPDNKIVWVCSTASTAQWKYVPSECRH